MPGLRRGAVLRTAVDPSHNPLKTTLKNSWDISATVKDCDHLKRFRLWPVDNEIGIDGKELYRSVRQALAPVSSARRLCQENDFFANDGLYTIRKFDAALVLEIPPDLYEVARGFGREDVTRARSGLDFMSAR